MKRLAIAALVFAPALAAQSRDRVAGTYALRICSSECSESDTAGILVSGYLVLAEHGLDLSSIPVAARYRLREKESVLTRDGRIDACFSLKTRQKGKVMAGIIPYAVTKWELSGDTIAVALYGSPDAWYVLRAIARNGKLSGPGRESGFLGSWFDDASGVAAGERIGPPDLLKCFSPSLVSQELAFGPPREERYEILALIDRRDREQNVADSTAVLGAYHEYSTLTDVFGRTYSGVDSLIVYRRRIAAEAGSRPRKFRRTDWPVIMTTGGFAVIEEYIETVDAVSTPRRQSGLRRTRRISILTRRNGGWRISREVTLDQR